MKRTCIILLSFLSVSYCQAQSTDTLLINRNDNLFFEAEHDLKNNLKFKEVAGITDSTKTIIIQVTYSSEGGTMLKISNPFPEQLMYKAELYSYKKKDYVETSTIPVYPKLMAFETWPYKIDKLRLTGFKLMPAD